MYITGLIYHRTHTLSKLSIQTSSKKYYYSKGLEMYYLWSINDYIPLDSCHHNVIHTVELHCFIIIQFDVKTVINFQQFALSNINEIHRLNGKNNSNTINK